MSIPFLDNKERLSSGSFSRNHFASRIGSPLLQGKRDIFDYVELLLKWSWAGGAKR
jgi:hypothetical protein